MRSPAGPPGIVPHTSLRRPPWLFGAACALVATVAACNGGSGESGKNDAGDALRDAGPQDLVGADGPQTDRSGGDGAGGSGAPRDLGITLTVDDPTLPATVGVPIAAALDVRDASLLRVVDPDGAPVPSSARALVRWSAPATDTTKPIRWALVDFIAARAGIHRLVWDGPAAAAPTLDVEVLADRVRVANGRAVTESPKTGQALLTKLQIDGVAALGAPLTLGGVMARGAMVVDPPEAGSPDVLRVSDEGLLAPGDVVSFVHVAPLKWSAPAGATDIVVTDTSMPAGHTYRIDEGTPFEEDIVATESMDGRLRWGGALAFAHEAGARVRDLTEQSETATIAGVSDQKLTFTTPLAVEHTPGSIVTVAAMPSVDVRAVVESTTVESQNALRVVIRQDGHFEADGARVAPTLGFSARTTVWAGSPVVKVSLRVISRGRYGFAGWRYPEGSFGQPVLWRSLSLRGGAGAAAFAGADEVTTPPAAHTRVEAGASAADVTAGPLAFVVAEFAENFPQRLRTDGGDLDWQIWPDTDLAHVFDGARAKTFEAFVGPAAPARSAAGRVRFPAAILDPTTVAQSGAVRPALVEVRDWRADPRAAALGTETREAAARLETMLACAYAVERCEGAGSVPPVSIFEYRLRNERGLEHFGWQNFGDLGWDDGYSNLHYDLPYLLLREYLRSGDARAFRLGIEMSRYRADWGQVHADEYWDTEAKLNNFRGMAFYEKGYHGSFREPVPSHWWVEGTWLSWVLTGDETAHEAAMEAVGALKAWTFTYDNALSWNESRWLGWPLLAEVVSWRYTGDRSLLDKAAHDVGLLLAAEDTHGGAGYYIAGDGGQTQPFIWGGYAQIGVIEYLHETGEAKVRDFLIRVARWLRGETGKPPVLAGGTSDGDAYMPLGTPYFWREDGTKVERPDLALGQMSAGVLTHAARLENDAGMRATARQLLRDVAFYRDLPVPAAVGERHVINFRSLMFGGSSPKIYGQTGQFVFDALPDLAGALVLPPR